MVGSVLFTHDECRHAMTDLVFLLYSLSFLFLLFYDSFGSSKSAHFDGSLLYCFLNCPFFLLKASSSCLSLLLLHSTIYYLFSILFGKKCFSKQHVCMSKLPGFVLKVVEIESRWSFGAGGIRAIRRGSQSTCKSNLPNRQLFLSLGELFHGY